jgi:hypothetical protein
MAIYPPEYVLFHPSQLIEAVIGWLWLWSEGLEEETRTIIRERDARDKR